jgi:hypothetical protein
LQGIRTGCKLTDIEFLNHIVAELTLKVLQEFNSK